MGSYLKYLPTISANYSSNSGNDQNTTVDTTTKKQKKYADIISSFQQTPNQSITPPATSTPKTVFEQIQNDKSVIKAPEKQTFWGSIKQFGYNLFNEQSTPASAAVDYNLQGILAKNTGKTREEIPLDYVSANRNAITKELGIRNEPTTREMVSSIMQVGMLAGLGLAIEAGAPIIAPMIGFGIINQGTNLAVSKIKGEKYNPLQSKGLADLLPEGAPEDLKTGLDVLQTVLEMKAFSYISKKSPKIAESLTKDITTKYNIPEPVKLDSNTVKQFYIDDSKLDPKIRQSLIDVGLTKGEARNAIQNGITIEKPWQKVVTVTDKPYWSKVKSIFKISETPTISTVTNLEKPSIGARSESVV